jgi:hypothetical protein
MVFEFNRINVHAEQQRYWLGRPPRDRVRAPSAPRAGRAGNCTQPWPSSRPNHLSPIHGPINQRLFQPGPAKAFEIVLPVAVPLDGHLISKPSQGDVGLSA